MQSFRSNLVMVFLEVDSRVKESNYNYLHGLMGGFRIYFERLERQSSFFCGNFLEVCLTEEKPDLIRLTGKYSLPENRNCKSGLFHPICNVNSATKSAANFLLAQNNARRFLQKSPMGLKAQ